MQLHAQLQLSVAGLALYALHDKLALFDYAVDAIRSLDTEPPLNVPSPSVPECVCARALPRPGYI